MNTTHEHRSLVVAVAIVVLALSGCAATPADGPSLVSAHQQAAEARLDRAAAPLPSDNDPRGYHRLAPISGMTGLPPQTSEQPRTAPSPTPRVNDNDPRGHHRLPAIEGADGFGVPTPPLVSDDDPRGHHLLPQTRR
ncbi:hypothetical protein [Agromyces humatus]|uniref:Lipoprotein n=1 Tax=Agromyces humatus TaxID=279573 RepID=A0ABN2KU01_9MICO|nr:hypothetical protein [Agromyces humatus]